MTTFIHESADIGDRVTTGNNAKIWHYAQVREDAVLGEGCVICRRWGVYRTSRSAHK
jgi:UDP-3-O-[3-hydroxymyristoyl] glucosamine N-acyltransferase